MSRARLLLATLAAYLPAAALPALASRHDLPGGQQDEALLVVPFCLGFAVAFGPWGTAADRVGPARLIRLALVIAAGAGVLVAVAPTPALLAVARGLQGAAAAGIPPAVQAQLAADAAHVRTGRALSGMMLAVAMASLVGPLLALGLAAPLGWAGSALVVGSALPLVLALTWTRTAAGARRAAAGSPRVPFAAARGVHAGWLVSGLVLGGYWTVLTRLTEALGPHGLGAPSGWAGAASLTGLVGLPLVVAAARASDAVGPRRPMVGTLGIGGAGFALAATAGAPGVFVATAGLGLAAYWAYLPVVAAQVQLSAGAAARGRAAGGLYASMWIAAAGAGALASLAPSWRMVLAGAGIAWGLAALVAARGFLAHPASAADSRPWPSPPQPSPR